MPLSSSVILSDVEQIPENLRNKVEGSVPYLSKKEMLLMKLLYLLLL